MKNYLEKYISEIQAEGKLYFKLDDIKEKFSANYESALKFSLNRLINKGAIVSLHRGFYVIIPPEYSQQKILPPELFIDALFKHLRRPYYIGLLSAAVYHGASHQQPQEYFVIIDKPAIRATEVENLKINYIVNSNLSKSKLQEKKTRVGYIKVSNPEQTAVDLVKFQNRIGGLNRTATVLYELVEEMDVNRLKEVIKNGEANSVNQRLGYILGKIIQREDLAHVIYEHLQNNKIFRVPLKAGIKKKDFDINNKWKIIENYEIEADF